MLHESISVAFIYAAVVKESQPTWSDVHPAVVGVGFRHLLNTGLSLPLGLDIPRRDEWPPTVLGGDVHERAGAVHLELSLRVDERFAHRQCWKAHNVRSVPRNERTRADDHERNTHVGMTKSAT